jgi:hypothetical protein
MLNKFKDIHSLIFDGHLKTTIKFNDFVIVIRTLNAAEEDYVIETYQNLPKVYNTAAAIDTIQRSIYSINGCIIKNDDTCRKIIQKWPQQIVAKMFRQYIILVNRAKVAVSLINDFVETDESKLRWSVVKATKSSINSATITGRPDFENKGLTFIQQLWIFSNQKQDENDDNKLQWSRIEYMTESICTFINPKAMDKIQNRKKLLKDEEFKREQREEMKQIQEKSNEKVMIENTADDLFDSLNRRSGESAIEYTKRYQTALVRSQKEDEHDRIVREYEEYEFCRQLRIKKENSRRSKLLHDKRIASAIVIELPNAPSHIQVGYQQVSTLGDDAATDVKIQEQNTGNVYFVNGVDYSEIIEIVSFKMLKNRDNLFKMVMNESDDDTLQWINVYIKNEEQLKSDVASAVEEITKSVVSNEKIVDNRDALLDRRERIVNKKFNTFEDRQKEMISQIQSNSRR